MKNGKHSTVKTVAAPINDIVSFFISKYYTAKVCKKNAINKYFVNNMVDLFFLIFADVKLFPKPTVEGKFQKVVQLFGE